MRCRLPWLVAGWLLAGCGGAGDGGTGGGGTEDAGRDAEADVPRDTGPDCELGQVLQDGRCYRRCGVNGPICGDDELCVFFGGEVGCRRRCGAELAPCPVGELCHAKAGEPPFCAEGECPEGSHRGSWGYCICDSGDIPPPGSQCVVELCGPGNPRGECPGEQICVDGVCR